MNSIKEKIANLVEHYKLNEGVVEYEVLSNGWIKVYLETPEKERFLVTTIEKI